jgi:hypothetical protein
MGISKGNKWEVEPGHLVLTRQNFFIHSSNEEIKGLDNPPNVISISHFIIRKAQLYKGMKPTKEEIENKGPKLWLIQIYYESRKGASRLIKVMHEGKEIMVQFEPVRTFKDEEEALKYATENSITDIKMEEENNSKPFKLNKIMKNTIAAVIFIIMSLPVISYSQFLTGFGIKGGATLSEQKIYLADGSTFYDTKPIIGYNASIYAEIINNKAFSLVIEPGYEQRGHSIEFIRTDEFGNELGIDDWFFRTYYITIGALAKIRYSAKSVSPYLIIGPRLDLYLGYNISASNEEFYPWINEMKSPVHEDTKKTNYSLNWAGMQFEKLFLL